MSAKPANLGRPPRIGKPRTWKGWAIVTHPERDLAFDTTEAVTRYLIFETRAEAKAMLWGAERVVRVLITEVKGGKP